MRQGPRWTCAARSPPAAPGWRRPAREGSTRRGRCRPPARRRPGPPGHRSAQPARSAVRLRSAPAAASGWNRPARPASSCLPVPRPLAARPGSTASRPRVRCWTSDPGLSGFWRPPSAPPNGRRPTGSPRRCRARWRPARPVRPGLPSREPGPDGCAASASQPLSRCQPVGTVETPRRRPPWRRASARPRSRREGARPGAPG